MIIQGLIASTSSAGGGTPPGPYISTQWQFDSDDTSRISTSIAGWWLMDTANWINGTGSTWSSPLPAWTPITWEDNSSGHTYDFNGTAYMFSPFLSISNQTSPWTSGNIEIQIWFYPTSVGCQIMSMTNTSDVTTSYHATVFEITPGGYLYGRIWPYASGSPHPGGVTSSAQVNLNQWNHAYIRSRVNDGMTLELNGVYQGSSYYAGSAYQGPGAGTTRIVIGANDTTSVTTSGAFQGKIGKITVRDDVVGSDYLAQRGKYLAYPNTYTSSNPPAEGTNATWDTSKIVGSHTTWPPGAVNSGTGAVMIGGAYVSVPVELKKGSWTIELVAELPTPGSFWASVFGNEASNSSSGYFAYFGNGGVTDFNVGRPGAVNTYDLTPHIGTKSHWAFVNDGNTMSFYRNGALINPTSTGFSQPTYNGPNNLYLAARHSNDGSATAVDTCYMTIYKYIISDTALSGVAIASSYATLAVQYGI